MDTTRKVILVIEHSTSYGRGILKGIAKYSRLHGPWSINLDPWEIYNRELPRMKNWAGQGMIVRVASEKVADRIMECGLPAITLASDTTKRLPALKKDRWSVFPLIQTDSHAIGQMAAQHFLDRGFKNVAYCGIPYCSWSQKRKESFSSRIKGMGFGCNIYTEPRLKKDRIWDNEQRNLAKWLKTLPKPIGLMACNDARARYVIETARIIGIMIPEEIAIIGVDDDDLLCEISNPQLSSIALNTEQAGYEAAALLDKLIDGEPMAGQVINVDPIRVITRQSTNILAISDKEVSTAIRYIREHAKDMIRVDDVVNAVSSSRRLMERRFQKVLGRSILKEIQRIRVELAKEFLVKTELSIAQVAKNSGFSNATHMGVIFRRELGLTPLAYRKKFRNR